MSAFTFEYCALYYLNWWLTRDRTYIKALTGDDPLVKADALVEAAAQYRVARNLPLAYDVHIGVPRLKPILVAVTQARREDFEGDRLVPSILKVRDHIANQYGGHDALSLTTKFLWLQFQTPIIIYDGNARRALETADGDLGAYCLAWRTEYERRKKEILAACDALPAVRQFCVDPAEATPNYISETASTQWFQERVLDIHLWHRGAQ